MKQRIAFILVAALASTGLLAPAHAAQPDLGTEAQRQAGKVLYDKYCTQCHGDSGNGLGTAAGRVKPRPRDFTSGKYKIRSTPSGFPPTTQDLITIIRDGLPYTSMPPWPQLSEAELAELSYYLKSFSPNFADAESLADPVSLPEPPPFSEESAQRGAEVYKEIGCPLCHGELARGDGGSAPTLKDDWGDHIRAADLTKRWTFRGGPDRKDIFRAFTTALNGTPMPSYGESLSEEQRWELTDYIWALSPADDPGYNTTVVAEKVLQEIDLADTTELFAAAQPAHLPVIGQIMEPGREFYPSATGVEVRAVYNDSDVAMELRWNDMRAETTGNNGPALAVPRYEDDPLRGTRGPSAPAGDQEGEDDFWGDEGADEEDDFWAEEEPAAAEEVDFWADEEAGTGGASLPAGPDNEFSDAVAVQFPSTLPSGTSKPYFIFGDGQNPVDLWFMDLARDRPEMFVGRGSALLESQGLGELSSKASYDRGQWTVVFKRSLREGGITMEEGNFLPVALSVWDGFNRERGNKRGLTRWASLYLKPGGEESATGPVLKAVLATLGLEILLIVLVRRRRKLPAS